MARREFTVVDAYSYNRAGPVRWIVSHLLRYKTLLAGFLVATVAAGILNSTVPLLIGSAFTAVLHGAAARTDLAHIALTMLAVVLGVFALDAGARSTIEFLGKRLARDAADELYVSLLGKSQTFHNRQRVGDIMARASNDVSLLSDMIVPGVDSIVDSFTNLLIPIIFIAFLNPQLLLAPLLFTAVFAVALRDYTRRLAPVSAGQREQFGLMNAGLTETVAGIDVVKSTAQEEQERRKFEANARRFRDFYVQSGYVQARYLPVLLLAIALAGAFVHGLILVTQHRLSVGGLISYMGLLGALRYPAFISIFTFNLVQLGIAGAARILGLMEEESELDENEAGHRGEIRGEIVFEHVSFGYGDAAVLHDVSFRAAPGETVAIVGQTGAGKSTLTKLVNRIYDVDAGRIAIDGVDVRDWNLAALRSQVSVIEQDIFLFSRSIAENISFGRAQATSSAVEAAAHDAQAHGFISGFKDGYATVIGERGVTLSGGQRQRLAIARALLTDPRILILDDSTSAIDSATEDEIQKAIARLAQGRTTLLITHRLSQIRWANKILVLQHGELVDQGTHDELLRRCELYHRIFAPYETSAVSHQPSAVGAGARADG